MCFQDGNATKLTKAQITLNDCLACSGCITSAESVLITQQSQEELYKVIATNKQAIQVEFEEARSFFEKMNFLELFRLPQSHFTNIVWHDEQISGLCRLTSFGCSSSMNYDGF